MSTTPQRRTRQRAAVVEVLAGNNAFLTAQEIHEALGERGAPVGLATVYRTLTALAEAGQVDVLRTGDGQTAYRGCERTGQHHHHLICRRCGRTVEFQLPGVEMLVDALAADHGFTGVDHELELYGTCPDCR